MNGSGILWSYDKFKGFSTSDSKWEMAGTYEVVRPLTEYLTEKYSLHFMIYVEG